MRRVSIYAAIVMYKGLGGVFYLTPGLL